MSNIFKSVKVTRPSRTAFSLSHQNLFTTDFGRLTPICFLDGVPGDTFNLNCAPLVRFAPMSSPPFGKVDTSVVWFSVPYRLVNGKFQKFITGYYEDTNGSNEFLKRPNMMLDFGQLDGNQSKRDFLNDYFNPDKYLRYSLLDYIGIRSPRKMAPQWDKFESARFLAFWQIYFEYFVDQNLGYTPENIHNSSPVPLEIRTESGRIDKVYSIKNWEQFCQIILYKSLDWPSVGGCITLGDCISNGLDIIVYKCSTDVLKWFFTLPSKCWPKDYFTSALPWAQKGNPVTVPVIGDVTVKSSNDMNSAALLYPVGGNEANPIQYGPLYATADKHIRVEGKSTNLGINQGEITSTGRVNNLSFTINELRTSYALQSWLEKNARCGSRYIEQILSHFGVRSSDARLQRPEYLGGFKTPVHVNSVAQTSEDGVTPQGNLAGNALSAGVGKQITYFCEEHTLIIGLLYVQPQAIYSQGVSRLLKRSEFYDFYFPEFAHLGEQEITKGELWYDCDSLANSLSTFGYQSRYSEYKFMNNELHGDYNHDSLRSWIFGLRDWDSQPSLSPEFLQVSYRNNKSLLSPWPVVTNDGFDKLYCQVDFDIRALRPMPKYGTPYL